MIKKRRGKKKRKWICGLEQVGDPLIEIHSDVYDEAS